MVLKRFSFGSLVQFWNLIGEIQPHQVAAERGYPIEVIVAGPAGVGKRTLASTLIGTNDPGALASVGPWMRLVEAATPDLLGGDDEGRAVIHVADATAGPEAIYQLRRFVVPNGTTRTLFVLNKIDLAHDVEAFGKAQWWMRQALPDAPWIATRATDPKRLLADLGPPLLAAFADRPLALGFRLPGLRPVVAESLIRQTAMVNAQFALLSSLPANIPILGGLAATSADLLVLTKNQMMLVIKLAALTGRPSQPTANLLVEIAPVVGSAFVWRTIARTLLGLVPGAVGMIPKAAIAYVGTYVVGRAASTYYLSGVRPPLEMIEQFTRDAWESFRLWRGGPPQLPPPSS